MKAAYIEATGAAESTIKYGELPQPRPSGTQVLVKTGAVAVNPIDTYLRNGANYWELPKPFVIGCDLAGTIEAVGPQVKRLRRRPRLGLEPGPLGPARDVCRVCCDR
jgi:NADPH2:quinone reductase